VVAAEFLQEPAAQHPVFGIAPYRVVRRHGGKVAGGGGVEREVGVPGGKSAIRRRQRPARWRNQPPETITEPQVTAP